MDARDELLKLENQLFFALVTAARNVVSLYRPVLEPLGLTHPQYLVMLTLWEQSPRTVAELGTALLLEPATISPLLKRLEAAGLVTRSRSTTDERALAVGLTEQGAALRTRALDVPGQIIEALNLPISELESLRDSLHTVIAAATRPTTAG